MSDYFSQLPVELHHMILHHLSMSDILTSLCFVNKCLYTICLAYPDFHFDFTSCAQKKEQFELVCAHLPHVSSQIHSVTFADLCDGMMKVKIARFFSRFHTINDTFSKLHSITVCRIDCETWRSINHRLISLPSLWSLSIDADDTNNPFNISIVSELLRDLIYNSQTLKRLSVKAYVPNDNTFIVDRYPRASKSLIEHLTLDGIRVELKSILRIISTLKTLNTLLKLFQFTPTTRLHPCHILRDLTIRVNFITLEEIEYMLHSMTQLTHFTITSNNVQYDMADGVAWSRLLKTVVVFKFKFTFEQSTFTQPSIDLISFRTPFWLEEKHWYVTYDRCIDTGFSLLYSTPYSDDHYPLFYMKDAIVTISTAPTSTLLTHRNSLIMDYFSSCVPELLRMATHITRSSLEDCGTSLDEKLRYAATHANVSQITSLFAFRYETDMLNDVFTNFARSLPCLRVLNVSTDVLKLFFNHQWSNIIELRLSSSTYHRSESLTLHEIAAFCRSFAQIQKLTIALDTFCDLPSFFNNRMANLSILSIKQAVNGNIVSTDQMIKRDWIEKNLQLRNFYYSCDKDHTVHLWL